MEASSVGVRTRKCAEGVEWDELKLAQWIEEHRRRNGGKIHIGLGRKEVRIISPEMLT